MVVVFVVAVVVGGGVGWLFFKLHWKSSRKSRGKKKKIAFVSFLSKTSFRC